MNDTQSAQAAWLDARETLTLEQLCEACAMSRAELDELIEYGALSPFRVSRDQQLFSVDCLAPLRSAQRLRVDFELDLFTTGLVVGYLARIDMLQRRIKSLEAQLPLHVHPTQRTGPDLWHEPHPGQAQEY